MTKRTHINRLQFKQLEGFVVNRAAETPGEIHELLNALTAEASKAIGVSFTSKNMTDALNLNDIVLTKRAKRGEGTRPDAARFGNKAVKEEIATLHARIDGLRDQIIAMTGHRGTSPHTIYR